MCHWTGHCQRSSSICLNPNSADFPGQACPGQGTLGRHFGLETTSDCRRLDCQWCCTGLIQTSPPQLVCCLPRQHEWALERMWKGRWRFIKWEALKYLKEREAWGITKNGKSIPAGFLVTFFCSVIPHASLSFKEGVHDLRWFMQKENQAIRKLHNLYDASFKIFHHTSHNVDICKTFRSDIPPASSVTNWWKNSNYTRSGSLKSYMMLVIQLAQWKCESQNIRRYHSQPDHLAG